MKLSVLQVTEGLAADLGGTAVVVSHLSKYLAEQKADVSLFGLSHITAQKSYVPLDPRVHVIECKPFGWRRVGYSREIMHGLNRIPLPDLIHIHGIWRFHYHQVVRYAKKRGIPFVLSTHGMLEPWALNRNKTVKQLSRWLYQDKVLMDASCLHVTSHEEARTLRRLGFDRPIAIIPWGVEIRMENPKSFHPRNPTGPAVEDKNRIALFMSRLHPKKGLDLLFHAWAQVQSQYPDWKLVVTGFDENSYQLKLEQLGKRLGIGKNVVFLGPVQGDAKEEVFANAQLFILPSHSENFALVVLEALARRLPVITTKGTPWSNIADLKCGWWIELGVDQLAATLREAFGKTPKDLRLMGEIGREYVGKHFSWAASGQAMLQLYQWILGKNVKPGFVHEDKSV